MDSRLPPRAPTAGLASASVQPAVIRPQLDSRIQQRPMDSAAQSVSVDGTKRHSTNEPKIVNVVRKPQLGSEKLRPNRPVEARVATPAQVDTPSMAAHRQEYEQQIAALMHSPEAGPGSPLAQPSFDVSSPVAPQGDTGRVSPSFHPGGMHPGGLPAREYERRQSQNRLADKAAAARSNSGSRRGSITLSDSGSVSDIPIHSVESMALLENGQENSMAVPPAHAHVQATRQGRAHTQQEIVDAAYQTDASFADIAALEHAFSSVASAHAQTGPGSRATGRTDATSSQQQETKGQTVLLQGEAGARLLRDRGVVSAPLELQPALGGAALLSRPSSGSQQAQVADVVESTPSALNNILYQQAAEATWAQPGSQGRSDEGQMMIDGDAGPGRWPHEIPVPTSPDIPERPPLSAFQPQDIINDLHESQYDPSKSTTKFQGMTPAAVDTRQPVSRIPDMRVLEEARAKAEAEEYDASSYASQPLGYEQLLQHQAADVTVALPSGTATATAPSRTVVAAEQAIKSGMPVPPTPYIDPETAGLSPLKIPPPAAAAHVTGPDRVQAAGAIGGPGAGLLQAQSVPALTSGPETSINRSLQFNSQVGGVPGPNNADRSTGFAPSASAPAQTERHAGGVGSAGSGYGAAHSEASPLGSPIIGQSVELTPIAVQVAGLSTPATSHAGLLELTAAKASGEPRMNVTQYPTAGTGTPTDTSALLPADIGEEILLAAQATSAGASRGLIASSGGGVRRFETIPEEGTELAASQLDATGPVHNTAAGLMGTAQARQLMTPPSKSFGREEHAVSSPDTVMKIEQAMAQARAAGGAPTAGAAAVQQQQPPVAEKIHLQLQRAHVSLLQLVLPAPVTGILHTAPGGGLDLSFSLAPAWTRSAEVQLPIRNAGQRAIQVQANFSTLILSTSFESSAGKQDVPCTVLEQELLNCSCLRATVHRPILQGAMSSQPSVQFDAAQLLSIPGLHSALCSHAMGQTALLTPGSLLQYGLAVSATLQLHCSHSDALTSASTASAIYPVPVLAKFAVQLQGQGQRQGLAAVAAPTGQPAYPGTGTILPHVPAHHQVAYPVDPQAAHVSSSLPDLAGPSARIQSYAGPAQSAKPEYAQRPLSPRRVVPQQQLQAVPTSALQPSVSSYVAPGQGKTAQKEEVEQAIKFARALRALSAPRAATVPAAESVQPTQQQQQSTSGPVSAAVTTVSLPVSTLATARGIFELGQTVPPAKQRTLAQPVQTKQPARAQGRATAPVSAPRQQQAATDGPAVYAGRGGRLPVTPQQKLNAVTAYTSDGNDSVTGAGSKELSPERTLPVKRGGVVAASPPKGREAIREADGGRAAAMGAGREGGGVARHLSMEDRLSQASDIDDRPVVHLGTRSAVPPKPQIEAKELAARAAQMRAGATESLSTLVVSQQQERTARVSTRPSSAPEKSQAKASASTGTSPKAVRRSLVDASVQASPSPPSSPVKAASSGAQAAAAGGVRNAARQLISPLPEKVRARMTIDSAPAPLWQPSNALPSDAATVAGTITDERIDAASSITRHLEGRHTARGTASGRSKRAAELSIAEHRRLAAAAESSNANLSRRVLTKPAVPPATQSQMTQRAAAGGTGGRAPQFPSYASAPAVPPQVPHRLKPSPAGTRAVRTMSTGVDTASSAKPVPHSTLPTARAGQVAAVQQDMALARHDVYPSGYTAFPGDFLPPEESDDGGAYARTPAWAASAQGQAFGRMHTAPQYMHESGQAAVMRQVQGMPAEGATRLRSPVPSSTLLDTPPPGRTSGKALQGAMNDTMALDRMEGGLRGSAASRMLPTPPSAIKEEEYVEMELQYQRLHPSTAPSSAVIMDDGTALTSRNVIRRLVEARPRELASPPETPERAGGRAAGSSVPAWEQTPVPAHTVIRTDMQALQAVVERAKAESAAVLQFVEDSINASVVAVDVGEQELYGHQEQEAQSQAQAQGQGQEHEEEDIDEDQFTDARDTSMRSAGTGQRDDAGFEQQQQQQDFAESAEYPYPASRQPPFDTPAGPMRPRRYHQGGGGTGALVGYTPGPAEQSYVALHMGTPSPVPMAEHLSAIPPPPPLPPLGVPGQSPARAARAYAQAKGRAPASMPAIASPPSLVASKVAIDVAASQSRALPPRRLSGSANSAQGVTHTQGAGIDELTAGLEWANARAQTLHAERNLLDLQSRIGELGQTTAGMESSQMRDPLSIAADVRESVARLHAVQAQHEREDEMQEELDRSVSSLAARTVFPAFTKTADSLQLSEGGSLPARSVLTSPNTVHTGVLGTGSWGTAKSTPAGLGASTQSTASAASQLMFGTLVDGSARGPAHSAPSLPARQQPSLPEKQAAAPRHSVDMTESPIVSAQDEEGMQGPSLTALDLYQKPAGGAAGSAASRVPLEPRAAVPGGASAGRTAVGAPQASAQGVLAAAEGGSLAQKRTGGARRVPHGGVASAAKGSKPSATLIEEQGQSDVYAVVASAAPAPAPAAVQARWYVHPSCSALTIPCVLPEPSAGPLSTAVRICNTSSLPVIITVYGPDGAPLPVLAVHEQGQAPRVISGGPALMGLVAYTGDEQEHDERRRAGGEVLVPARGEAKVVLALALPPVPGYDAELDERGDMSIPAPVSVASAGWSYMHASHTLKAVLTLHGRHVRVGNGTEEEDEDVPEEEEEQAGSLTGLGFLSPTRRKPRTEPPSMVQVRMTVMERAWTLKGWSMDTLAGRLKADDRKVKVLAQMQAELPLARALASTSLSSPDIKLRSGRAIPQSTQGTPQHPAPALMQHLAIDGVAQGTTGNDGAGRKARVPSTPTSGQAGLASPASAVRGPSARVPHPASPLTMPSALVPQVKPKASSAASVGLEFAQAPSLTGSSSSSSLGVAMKTLAFPSTHGGQTSIVKVQICNTSQYPLAVQVALLKCTMSSFRVRPSHTMFTLEPRKYCMLPVTFSPPVLPTGAESLSALLDAGISMSPAGNISYNCLLRLTGSVASSAVDSEDDGEGVAGSTGMVRGKDGKAIRLLLQAMLVGESPHNMQQ